MRLKKIMAIALCSALVVTGSGISTMAGAVANGVVAEGHQTPDGEENELDEEITNETETTAEEDDTTANEEETSEEATTEAETEVTEEDTTEAETEATEEGTTEAESEATEEDTTEAETEATEEGTTEDETEATEESTTESETEVTEESTAEEVTTEAETKVPEETEAPMFMSLELEEESSEVTVSNEEELIAAVNSNEDSVEIVLKKDIALKQNLFISAIDVTLTSDGGALTCADGFADDSMIAVKNRVVLKNIKIDSSKMAGDEIDYSAIFVLDSGDITIDDGTEITYNGNQSDMYGLGIMGTGEMRGGTISGFTHSGIHVSDEAEFVFSGGEIKEIHDPVYSDGGGLVSGGTTTISGGKIFDCEVGAFTTGTLHIEGGEIFENETGVVNIGRDNITGETFSPTTTIKGGRIYNNSQDALWNNKGGTFIIEDGAKVEGSTGSAKLRMASVDEKHVIGNVGGSKLNIKGGNIISNADNEIAIYNDDTSEMTMEENCQITVTGANSIAILSDNKASGTVRLKGGSINVSGSGSKVLDSQGSVTVEGTQIEKDGKTNLYYINANASEGGYISLPDNMAAEGDEITVTIQPDSGYKISNVTVDGVSKGAVSSYTLKVTGAHTITAAFAKKPSSSGGGNGGGGGGSSRSTSTSTQSKTPETPGAWLQDQTGWKFALPTGGDYLNTWIYVKGQWYRIGLNGYMMQGWVVIDSKTYYLTPITGEMKTGWFIDNGSYYYLDSTGAVTTGWVQVNGTWYYLNADGKMAVNTTTPDGHQVGADGKRI